MWCLVATAAAGLNAGAGLHCILIESVPTSSDPTLLESYWNVAKATTNKKISLSSTLSTAAAAAALAAYFAGRDAPDPAYITCALLSGAIPLYNSLVLAPTANVVNSPVMTEQPYKERESWLTSYSRKTWIGASLGLAAFGCFVLVLGSGSGPTSTDVSSNPLRFTH